MNTEALRTVAATYGTPTYIFDVREVEARIRLLRSLLPEDTGLCFAVKANPFLIPYVADLVDRLEVCSPGEYEICIQEQIAPEKIVVSGVNKTYESMKRILSYSKGAGIYTIESEEHAKILRTLAEKNQMPLSVLIRLSSGNQFGVDAETFLRLAKEIQESPYLTLAGVHYYAGTQKRQSKLEKELDTLTAFAKTFEEETGTVLNELEYGAGMKVSYFINDSEKDQRESEPEPQIQALAEKLRTMCLRQKDDRAWTVPRLHERLLPDACDGCQADGTAGIPDLRWRNPPDQLLWLDDGNEAAGDRSLGRKRR